MPVVRLNVDNPHGQADFADEEADLLVDTALLISGNVVSLPD